MTISGRLRIECQQRYRLTSLDRGCAADGCHRYYGPAVQGNTGIKQAGYSANSSPSSKLPTDTAAERNMAPQFDNSYVQLPERFYARQAPVPVADPALICVNHELAGLLGIDPAWLESAEGINTIAGNRVPTGADPIATVYAGHQFGSFNPRLGDGRAILLGEVIGSDGERYDLQLKGSGITPFSRNGDGRAPLGADSSRVPGQRGHGGARRCHQPHARRSHHRRSC